MSSKTNSVRVALSEGKNRIIRGCRALSRRNDRMLGRIFDLRYGISTLPGDTPHPFYDNTHASTTYHQLSQMFRGLTVEPDDVFVDFGCGLGRVVCVAAQYPFAKVYGVEISSSAAARARSNIERLRSRAAGSIEIVCASAEEFDCRLANTFYFYNPFGEKMMAAMLANIKTAAEHSGRPIKIIYNYPMHKTLLDGSGWLSEKKVLIRRAFDRPPTLLYQSN